MGEGPKLVRHRGKLAVSFTAGGKRFRRSLGTDDVATARQRMADYIKAKDSQSKGALSVSDLFTAYLDDRRAEGKSTARMENAWLRLAPTFGNLVPEVITKDVCKEYARHRRESQVSNGTILLELAYLRSALTHAENANLIDRAPHIAMPQKPAPRTHYIPKTKAPEVVAAAVMPHVKLFIVIALSTAGRAGAILDLTWDRVNFEARTIDLRDPLRPANSKGRAVPPMNDMAYNALLKAKEGALSRYVIEWSGDAIKSVKKGVGESGRRAGIKVTPHVLRHSAAVWMAEAGVSMDEIAQYMGHTDSRTTYRVYARFSPEHLRKAAKALEF